MAAAEQSTQTDEELGATYIAEDPYASDSPEIIQCLSYWDSLRGDRMAPAWSDFDWLQFPIEIIPYCGVVDVVGEPVDLVYRFWGTAHATTMAQELTGKSVREMKPDSEGQSVFNQYMESYQARRPQLFVNTIHSFSMETEMKEISLRLPFSDTGEHVNQILAFSDMRQSLKELETAFYKAMSSARRKG